MTLRSRLREMAEYWQVDPECAAYCACGAELEAALSAPDEAIEAIDEAPVIVDKVAEAIYRSGAEDRADQNVPERAWRIPEAPWDLRDDELCEWERDDYRIMARAAILAYGQTLSDETTEALRGLVAAAGRIHYLDVEGIEPDITDWDALSEAIGRANAALDAERRPHG